MQRGFALSLLLACSLAVCAVICGCGKAKKAASPQQPILGVVGVSLWKTDDPWRTQMLHEIKTTFAKHPDIRVVIQDAEDDDQKQKAHIEGFIANRVGVIIVSPKSPQVVTEPVADAYESGIPVIVLDRPLIGNKFTCLVQPNNKQIGTAIAQWLGDKLEGKGRIVAIKGPVDSVPNRERYDAFRSAMLDPSYRFMYEGYVDPPRVDAAKIMQEAMASATRLDAVFAFDDEAAKDAYDAAKAVGREKGMLFVGIGGLVDGGQKFVSEGIEDASFLQPTGGSVAVNTAVKLLVGEPVPKSIILDTRLFTKENVQKGGEPVRLKKK